MNRVTRWFSIAAVTLGFAVGAVAQEVGGGTGAAAPDDLLDLLGNLQNVPPAPATEDPGMPAVEAPEPEAAEETAPAVATDAARELFRQEELRRQAWAIEGRQAFAAANEAMRRSDYPQAFTLFSEALAKLPDLRQNDDVRRKAVYGRGEAAYQLALGYFRRDQLELAKAQAAIALEADEAGHGSRVRTLQARIADRVKRAEEESVRIKPVGETEEVLEKAAQIEHLFSRGKQWFDVGDYDRSEITFEQILLKDPYHLDTMRFLKRIEERRLEASNLRRRATVEDMVQDVRERWNPPIRRSVTGPIESDPTTARTTTPDTQQLREKLQAIVIPSISFRQASIAEVINFLRDASEAHDPQKIGVNIILKLDTFGGGPAAMPPPPSPAEDMWGPIGGGPGAPAPAAFEPAGMTAITLTLRRVTLFDAIKYVTEVAGLKFRLEGNAVIITPRDVVFNVITRLYPVMPSIMTTAIEKREETGGAGGFGGGAGLGGGSTIRTTPDDDIKGMFERMGVPFPPGTSISYNSAISQLIVTNTSENLEMLERILPQISGVPSQVTIESRFVEVAQTDLEEFGFEWMLTDHWQVANKKGGGPLASRERVQVNQNAAGGGLTKGLRFFSGAADNANPSGSTLSTFGGMTGTLFSISSVLTNPELTFVLHALNQKGGTDLLSAPRVTTRSGVNAQIQVVEEIIYPTEYEEQTVEAQIDTGFRVPIPSAFETREVGVILNVTPTVGPDGYTIDLTLVPEVAELSGWIDYGPPERYPILQPIFSSRNVTTSVVLWDNQTLALGGMIRDQVTRFDDKVPILGDIPLLGRLFRSKGERSAKRNLIVFVTARLINPAGAPIRDEKDAVGERW